MISTLTHLFAHKKSNHHKPRLLHVEGIVVLVLLTLCSQAGVRLFSGANQAMPAILGFTSSIRADDAVRQTNARRAAAGLSSLQTNSQLVAAAAAKGNDMCTNQYWAHVSPAGKTPWVFMRGAGYRYAVAGENLARDFADTSSMVDAWMASPTHRANIINTKYTEIGIAVIHCTLLGTDTALVVQMFGTQMVGTAVGQTGSGTTAQPVAQVQALTTEETLPVAEPTPQRVAGEESVPETLQAVDPVLELGNLPPVSSPLQMQKIILISILSLVLTVLLIDMWLVHERNVVRISSRSLAHALFLSGILIVIVIVKAGAIL